MSTTKWKMGGIIIFLLFFTTSIVEASWQDKMRGYAIFPTSPDSYWNENFKQTVTNLKSIGADTISLIVPWYQDNIYSNSHHRGWNTASDLALSSGMQYVTSKGLDVALLFHADVDDGSWRAKIDPSNRDAWFDSMGGLIKKYARDFASPYGAELFSVGTEMHHTVSNSYNPDNASRSGKYRWADIIDDVREEYDGNVTYSAQHSGSMSSVFEDNDLISNLDMVGFSAYWGINAPKTQDDVRVAWEAIERNYLVPAHERYNKEILFMEGGYRPCSWTLDRPWDNWTGCSYDGEAQAFAYEQMLSFLKDKSYLYGAPSLWAFEDDPLAGGVGNTQYTPWGKPAEDIIRSYWKNYYDDGNDDENNDDDVDDGDVNANDECVATIHTSTNGGWGFNEATGKGCLVGSSQDDNDDENDDEGEGDDQNNNEDENEECVDWDGDGWGWDGEKGCKMENGDEDGDEDGDANANDECVATIHTSTNGGWGFNEATGKGCLVDASEPIVLARVNKESEESDESDENEEEGAKEQDEKESEDENNNEEEAEEEQDEKEKEDECVATDESDENGGWGFNEATGKGCEL